MAYSVNGKIYTDHPLMDEIVDCCKTILKDIVIKNEALAISYETDESISESEEYMNIANNKVKFSEFPFTKDMLSNFTRNGVRVFDDDQIDLILRNRNVVPKAIRNSLMEFCRSYYMDNYEERNNYYRCLAGLPPYKGTAYNVRRERSYISYSDYDENDTGYYFFLYPSDFPSDYDTSTINFSKPIHEQPIDVITILQQNGAIDGFLEEYKGFNYSYLRYLGYKSIPIYKSRKAIKFEIIYMPTVEQLVQQRFEELYNINRTMYIRRTYQEAISLGSNHFDESFILLLLCQTFNDLVAEVPEWYIRRDIFDIRSVQYFLESFGVEFFPDIPLKYQIAIVKNLNKLIKYKSSNRNNNDIIDLFNLKNTYVYKYFLYKKKLNDSASTEDDNYDLEFIKVKQGDAFDKYIEDNIYRYKYDDLTLSDKFWDGVCREWEQSTTSYKERLHEDVKNQHIKDADYTVEGTKYMSIDYEVGMSEYSYQVQYFFGYLLDSNIDAEDLKIIVPSINSSSEIPISHLFILLYLLSFSYDNVSDKIRRPEDTNSHTESITTEREEYYEQLYRDDGDFDDYYSWNNKFSTYNPPDYAFADNKQFNFGGVNIPTNLNDDEEFEFGDIRYNLDYLAGEYDFEDMLDGEDTEFYNFNDPNFDDEDYNPYGADDGIYNFYNSPPEEIPNPEIDNGYEFNGLIDTNPEEYFIQFFVPKHWEIKTYIENLDYDATEQGYNSFPVWVDCRDWAKRRVPETLEISYNRVAGFNSTLEPEDLDKIFEVLGRANKIYNFDRGYSGYSYRTVRDSEDNILYYEIIYDFDEPLYTYEEYLQYIDPEGTPEFYNLWLDTYRTEYMRDNPRGPLGIGGFRIVRKLDSISDIMDNFDINTVCYNDLRARMINSNSRDEAIMLKYVYDNFFTREFDYNFYKVNGDNATYLREILKDKNYMLYNFYNSIISESNINTRKDNIRSLMNDIITTLEYYLSGDNIEYIYSVFSITSFSSLLYYIYLMINFFKSWKVYFLDPAVTMNANDRLENTANNYGNGIDSIAEIKSNYWYEDKEFKRDGVGIDTDYTHRDETYERYKEIVDVYGHFDPDPQLDYDFDGFSPENDNDTSRHNITRRDLNGGISDGKLNIPYNMVNGGKSYGKLIDIWDLDGSGPEEHVDYLRVDGGYALWEEELSIYPQDKSFNYMINGGEAGTNLFWTKSMHTKVIDRQIEQHALVSDKEGNLIKETPEGLYIEQAWASWQEFNDVKRVSDIAFDYIDYVMEVLYDDLVVITDEESLQIRINEIINEDLSNMRKVVSYAKNIDRHEADYKNYIDAYERQLRDEYEGFSPYNWLEFVDNH